MKMKSSSSSKFEFGSQEPTFGCVSSILRHFRYRHRISTQENYTDVVELSTTEINKPQSPNIVARLMGLDSMPISPNSDDSDSFSRSLSKNSVQSWPGILTERTNASSVKSSVSFHEKPIYLREENADFLIISFTPDGTEEESLLNWGKCRSSTTTERKKRRIRRKPRREKRANVLCDEKENCTKLERVQRKGFVKCDKNGELPLILDLEKIKLMQRKVVTDCISQNSSPVSVLDLPETHDDCPTQPNSPSSDAEGDKPQANEQSSRRKLSSNFESIEGSFSPSNFEANKESKKVNDSRITLHERAILKHFVEEDFKNSTWYEQEIKKTVHAEEIATEIGFEILDALLSDITSEICSNFI